MPQHTPSADPGIRSIAVRLRQILRRSIAPLSIVLAACAGDRVPTIPTPPAQPAAQPAAPPTPASQLAALVIAGPDSAHANVPTELSVQLRDRTGASMAPPTDVTWTLDDTASAGTLTVSAGGRATITGRLSGRTIRVRARVYDSVAVRAIRVTRAAPAVARFTFSNWVVMVRASETGYASPLAVDSAGLAVWYHDEDVWWYQSVPWRTSDSTIAYVQSTSFGVIRIVALRPGTAIISSALAGVPGAVSVQVNLPLAPIGALPDRVAGGTSWTQLAGGREHTCGLSTGGDVYCWGANYYGQSGMGVSTDTAMAPAARVSLPGRATAIGAAADYACAAGDGEVLCWGRMLGVLDPYTDGYGKVKRFPLNGLQPSERVRDIAAGGGHICALTTLGGVYCWGQVDAGQGGPGSQALGTTCFWSGYSYSCRAVPGRMETELRFTQLVAGATFTCGLVAAGDAYCWGNIALGGPVPTGETCTSNGGPYAGMFPYPCRLTPLLVPGGHRFTALSARGGRACGVRNDGALLCWSDYAAPAVVPEIHDARTVAVGMNYVCAGLADGRVACWGDNLSLALGVSGIASSATAVYPAIGLAAATSLAVGDGHTCAVNRAGEAVCWGAQRGGQLGRGAFVR